MNPIDSLFSRLRAGKRKAFMPFLTACDTDAAGAVRLARPADLPALAAERYFKLIQLVTPTTPRPRAREIARLSTGFLYCVSVTGITGTRDRLPEELLGQLAWLRQETDLPLCVGFGI